MISTTIPVRFSIRVTKDYAHSRECRGTVRLGKQNFGFILRLNGGAIYRHVPIKVAGSANIFLPKTMSTPELMHFLLSVGLPYELLSEELKAVGMEAAIAQYRLEFSKDIP